MIGYMILAHEDTAQLRLLVDVLAADERSTIYLHMDARTAAPAWTAEPRYAARVTPVPSIRVNWAGYSMVEATLRLLRAALDDRRNEHFVLLSGSCFPIRRMAEINSAILRSGRSDVALWKRVAGPGARPGRREAAAIGKAHFMDVGWLNPSRNKLTRMIWRAYDIVNATMPYRLGDGDVVAKGSQWFQVGRHDAEEFVAASSVLEPRFRRSFAPDEMIFQTIFLRSCEREGRPVRWTEQTATRQALHYLRFRPAPTGRSILEKASRTIDLRLLTLGDLDEILASDALFTRKCTLELCEALYARSRPSDGADPMVRRATDGAAGQTA